MPRYDDGKLFTADDQPSIILAGDSAEYGEISLADLKEIIEEPIGSANQLLGVNGAGTEQEYKTLSGTSNQITVTNSSGGITLALPQSIATTSEVQFGKVGVNTAPTRVVWDVVRALQVEGTDTAGSGVTIIRNSNDGTSGTLYMCKSRATTNGGNGIVQVGDQLGSFSFMGNDGTGFNREISAGIGAFVAATPSSGGIVPAYINMRTQNTSGVLVNAMRILENQNVLIQRGGTFTDTGETLQVTGTMKVTGAVSLTTALGVASGGTGLSSIPTNGQLNIGNGTGFTRAAITGTTNQITVTNGAGTITLSLPQSIATSSTPTFNGLTSTGQITNTKTGGGIYHRADGGTTNASYNVFNNTGGNYYYGVNSSTGGGLFGSSVTAYAFGICAESARDIFLGTNNSVRVGVFSTGEVNIGSSTTRASASALFSITSTTQGFLPPRMTTTQRDAISSPAAGLLIYNTSTNKLNVYTTTWEAVTSA